MTDNENQEPGSEKVEASDDKLESPALDFGELRGTGETDAEPVSVSADETAVDMIDISDEEAQQEFKEMEREESEANDQSDAPEEAAEPEPVTVSDTQADAPELPPTEEVKKESSSVPETKEDPALGKMDELDTNSEAGGDSRFNELFSRKIIYASVAGALSISAIIMIFIFGFDSGEPEADSTAATEEEPFPFVSREPIADAEPPSHEDESEPLLDDTEELAQAEVETPSPDEHAEVAGVAEDDHEADPSLVETELDTEFPVSIEEEEEVATVAQETLAATEEAEEIATTTEPETAVTEEIPVPELEELTEQEPEEIQLAVEETENIPEQAAIVAEEETPVVEPIASAQAPSLSSQAMDNLAILNQSSNSFYIIVASFNSEEMALKHASTLPENLETEIIIPPFEQVGKYRVAIAGYETMAEAQTNIAQYKATYGNDIWPLRYTRADRASLLDERTGNTYVVVSSFLTESSARNHISSLSTTGAEPLIIPPFGQSKSYRVTLFSYETLAGAQQALPEHKEKYGEDIWLLKY